MPTANISAFRVRLSSSVSRLAVTAAAVVLLSATAATLNAKDANGWPTDVAASYRLFFNGFEVGKYNFNSRFNGKAYQASSSADISALFGAFKWKGDIQSSGTVTPAKPKPNSYVLSFKSKSKAGSVTLGFDPAGVKSVALVPNKPPKPEAVPIRAEHYKDVFDPMSAILAMSHSDGGNPCNRRIPIFDGKARFDLVMSYKGEERIAEGTPSGQPQRLVICRVKYKPIAGHEPKDFVNSWIDYNAIEIALRPVPSANVFVPYRITIPTTIGPAVMAAERVTITTPDQTEIAFTQ